MNHDQNFKNLILDYPHQALQFFATDEAHDIIPTTNIVPIRQEQLKERLGDRFRELDVPLLVEWPDGQREALLFVLEEESDPRRFSIHRLAHYCLDLSELIDTSRVVPVVIFLRDGQYQTTLTLGGDKHRYLDFSYINCTLRQLPWETYQHSNNLVARLNLPNMHYTPEQKVEVYAQAFKGLTELEPHPDRQLKYLDFIDIYTDLSDNERQRYHQQYPEDVKKMSNFAERFIEQGMQEGIQQGKLEGRLEGEQKGIQRGMQQGKLEGEVTVLLRQMELKFGPVTDDMRQRIMAADSDTILTWSERILTAQTPEEVVG